MSSDCRFKQKNIQIQDLPDAIQNLTEVDGTVPWGSPAGVLGRRLLPLSCLGLCSEAAGFLMGITKIKNIIGFQRASSAGKKHAAQMSFFTKPFSFYLSENDEGLSIFLVNGRK